MWLPWRRSCSLLRDGEDASMQPRSIKIVQTSLETGRERIADLCWASLVMISGRTRGRKSPSEVLDAMLWGDKVLTTRFAYRIDDRARK
jgi:hypothetical protein